MTMLPLLILLIFIFFSIYKYAPVDHINKVLEVDELLISKKKSRIIATMIFGTCIGLSMVIGPKHIIVVGTMMGALTASISLIIGSVKRGGEEDENN
jgi:accessory gene regulator protein AgrB